MTEQYSVIAYQHKIQILTDKNEYLQQQNATLKQSIQALHQGIAQLDQIRQQNNMLLLSKNELRDLLEAEKRRNQQLENRRYLQVKSLKEELNEKDNYIERMKIEHEKQVFRMNDQLRQTKLKSRRQDHLDEMSRSIAVSSSWIDYRPLEENSMDKSNRLSNYGPIERHQRTVNKSTFQSRLTQTQKQQSSSQKDYGKYSKQELKIALKALNKAGKSLRDGQLELSKLPQRQSVYRKL